MEKYHPVSYYRKCQEEGLTIRYTDTDLSNNTQPEFTHAGLVDRLVNWIVTNDQVSRT